MFQCHERLEPRRGAVAFRASREADQVARTRRQRHQRREAVLQRAALADAQAIGQNGVHTVLKGLFGHAILQRNLHQLAQTHYAHAQRRGEAKADMRVEAVGIADRQAASAQGALHGAHQVQVADIAQGFALFKNDHHSHARHTPLSFCRPQPLQPSRQSRVVWARMARSYSRLRNALSMPASMWSQGSSSSSARSRWA